MISETCLRSQCPVDIRHPSGLHLMHTATATVRRSLFTDYIIERWQVCRNEQSALLTLVLLINTIC